MISLRACRCCRNSHGSIVSRPSPLVLGLLVLALGLAISGEGRAEDGYDLWLRYRPLPQRQALATRLSHVVALGDSPTVEAARGELVRGLSGLLARPIELADEVRGDGAVIVGTPATSRDVAALGWGEALDALGDEGYQIESARVGARDVLVVASRHERGLLYGVFHLLRLVQTGASLGDLRVSARPRVALRMLNHWDNLNGSIERGYAGRSLWTWSELPGHVDPRIVDYARANASVGINATVLNNVNANAQILTTPYLEKVAALADTLRPWGMRVFLSARFSAPIELGGLTTADPLEPGVVAWWRAKADEIYARIPDFGGFLVKANAEGQPGPLAYGRSHAEGANALARAVAPHGGIVLWRAFVYEDEDPDRVKRAYNELKPLDGRFDANVVVQVKNGPLDFQPREPAHPLFGAMPGTPLAIELQITQEYLGHATHLVYLGPLWKEVLDWDTYVEGPGTTVARVIDGSVQGRALSVIAGVANTGSDRNWCGHPFAAANWFAFGRLAWDPDLTSEAIAREWGRMTWTHDERALAVIVDMMLRSREIDVEGMTPLGLHHLIDETHYDPGPWVDNLAREDWNPTYYHRADGVGLGFDRSTSGSGAVLQYASPLRERFDRLESCPDELLLWFHHVPWTHVLSSGRTLWNELIYRYDRGVVGAGVMRDTWQALGHLVDPERFADVASRLADQEAHLRQWREVCITYFGKYAHPEDDLPIKE